MKTVHLLTLALFAATLCSCEALTGKELARLPVNAVSTEGDIRSQEATLDLKAKDEVAIWSHMDMEYDGDLQFRFKIQLLKEAEPISLFEVDPTEKNITVGETRTQFGGHTNWSFTGKNETVTIADDGRYTFRAILVASDTVGLRLRTAEVVLKK
jgi:hypothetical protein